MKPFVSFALGYVLLLVAAPVVLATENDIVINEFQIEPSGSSQWVELYNSGDTAVELTGWFISDSADHSLSVPRSLLAPHECISFSSGSYHFNTATADSVILRNASSQIDRHDYIKSPGSNVSLGRSPDGSENWTSFNSPSQNALNEGGSICSAPSPTPTSTPSQTPTPTTPEPTASKTPTPTKVPTPTKTPTPTKSGPTPTKTPTPIKSGSISVPPTTRPQAKSAPSKPTTVITHATGPTAVLGISTRRTLSPTKTPSKSPSIRTTKQAVSNWFNPGFLLAAIGILLLAPSGILLYIRFRKGEI